MSYNLFNLINRFWHLSDNTQQPPRGDPEFDPWFKLRFLLDHINAMSKKYFVPERLISIDESMVGMKNR